VRYIQCAKRLILPVEQPIKFELVVNVEVPRTLLARGDEVIE
jgi:hypothetical protein